MILSDFRTFDSFAKGIYKKNGNDNPNLSILVIESKQSGVSILSTLKRIQNESFDKQITDSTVFITYSEDVYQYVMTRRANYPMIKDIHFIDNEENPIENYINCMKFDYVIMNPPFNVGGEVWDETRSHCNNENGVVCLMPLAQYKKNERYKYIASLERIENTSFDAAISGNLCVTTSQSIDNGKDYEDFLFDSFNQNYRAFYEWNRRNDKGLEVCRKDNKPFTDFDIDLDFIETNRLCAPKNLGGSGFGKDGCGYKFNVLKEGYEEKWIKGVALIHLNSQKEKDNFSKWWYSAPKEKGLSSKMAIGLNMVTISNLIKYAIPQIDWEKVSDHPSWKEGKYDEAVLDTMGLKWEGERIVEVR